jgi:hypothetical protein
LSAFRPQGSSQLVWRLSLHRLITWLVVLLKRMFGSAEHGVIRPLQSA